MVTVPIHDVGKFGVIRDRPPHELPPEAWSDGLNVRFEDSKILRSKGHTQVYGAPSVAPYWALFTPGLTANFWLYAGANKVFITDVTGTHTNITRQSAGVDVNYSMDEDILWNGGILGGIPIINNGVDTPQRWATIETGTKLDNLPNWPVDAKARILRPFKNFIIALDYTTGAGARFPHRVKWSHSADPGTVPTSWDETDPTVDAGEFDLTDVARGFIVDGQPLGDVFAIYKQASIWAMQFSGGVFIFRNISLIEAVGAFSKHCIAQVGAQGLPRHFIFTGDDLVLFDGRSVESLLDKRMRRWLLSILSASRLNRAFCQANFSARECWFCFPTAGADWPNMALVWNWGENTLKPRDIVEASYMAVGDTTFDQGVSLTWDSDTNPWDSDITPWDAAVISPNIQKMLQCAPVKNKLLAADDGDTLDGVSMTSFVERTGLAIAGRDRNGQPKIDYQTRKFISRLWPRVTGGPVSIRVGVQDDTRAPVVYSAPRVFDPTTQDYLDFNMNGRLIAVRIEGVGDNPWELAGYDIDVEPAGVI